MFVSLHHLIAKILKTIETMKASKINQNELQGDESLIGLSAQLKSLSEEENDSHAGKPTKDIHHNQKTGGSFLWLVKEGKNIPKRFTGKISEFNSQVFCVACGRDTQAGLSFCSISCEKDFYGI